MYETLHISLHSCATVTQITSQNLLFPCGTNFSHVMACICLCFAGTNFCDCDWFFMVESETSGCEYFLIPL